MTTFQIGTTYGGLADLDSILFFEGSPDPDWSYQPYSRTLSLGNGQIRGQGYAIAKWRWNAIDNLSREVLRTFVGTGLSATVYITTPTNNTIYGEPEFYSFQAIMRWPPTDEDFQSNKVLGLVIVFTHLVLQP